MKGASVPTVVRVATAADRDAVLAIDRSVLGRGDRAHLLASAIESGICLVAELGGSPAGFAILDHSFFGHAFVPLLIVSPDHRRRGVGAALLRHVEEVCESEKLFTTTNESNQPMRRLCESLGFVGSGTIENLDEGDPEVVYFKRVARGGKGARG